MIPKILTGIALALAVVTLIIKLVAVSVPHFVDVHFIANIDDVADDNVIAGVGIYQSVYDPTGDEIIDDVQEAGLPTDVINSATQDFVLLFPAQENFQAQLIPIDLEIAGALDAQYEALEIFGLDLDNELTDALAPIIEEIEELEFDNCNDYAVDALEVNTRYFTEVENIFWPFTVSLITLLSVEGINPQLQAIQAGIVDAASAPALVAAGLVAEAFAGAAALDNEQCGAFVDGTVIFDVAANFCFQIAAIEGAEALEEDSPNLSLLLRYFSLAMSGFSDNNQTINEVVQIVSGSIAFVEGLGGGQMQEVPEFAVNLGIAACDENDGFFGCENKAEYLEYVSNVLREAIELSDNNDEIALLTQARQAVFSYFSLFESGVSVQAETTFNDDIGLLPPFSPDLTLVPSSFGEPYGPCVTALTINALLLFTEQDFLDVNDDDVPVCTDFAEFLPAPGGILAVNDDENIQDLGALIGGIAALYQGCSNELFNPDGTAAEFCVENFLAPFLLGATPDVDPGANFNDRFVEACEDDNTDREAVAIAQGLVGFSAALNVVTIIVIIISFFLQPKIIAPVAGVVALFAGIFTLAGLLTVRGAPVYEGVGEEPNGVDLEPIFVEGYVAILALVEIIFSVVIAGLLIAAGVVSCFCVEGEDGDMEDKKEVAAVEDQL